MNITIETPEPDEVQKFFSEPKKRRLSELGQAVIACAVFWLLVFLFVVLCCRARGGQVTLTWDMPPASEQIRAWKVFRGIEGFPVTLTNRITIEIPTDQISTIAVMAENIYGIHSPPAEITVIPFTPKSSPGLKTWTLHPSRVIFLKREPRMFMSYDFPTP